jgi:hypothetical protein
MSKNEQASALLATSTPQAGSWNVKISGHPFDIGDMRECLPEPLQVVSIDGHDYLRIGGIDAAVDSQAAMDRASAVVGQVNGALAITRDDARPIKIEGGVVRLDADGRKSVAVLAEATASLKFRARGALVAIGPDGVAQPATEDAASRALSAAERHSNVPEALAVMGSGEKDRYYRLYEIVKASVTYDGILAVMGCEQNELQRFTSTVNKPRHQRTNGPPAGGAMNDREVHAFALRMFDCWIAKLDRGTPATRAQPQT